MGQIYGNAFFTISAACGRDGTDGLHPVLRTGYFAVVAVPDTNLLLREEDGSDATHGTAAGELMPLLDRGWVFQERLRSPRTLMFSKTQVIWQCRSVRLTEKIYCWFQESVDNNMRWTRGPIQLWDNARATPTDLEYAPSEIFFRKWHWVVYQYSELKLTYRHDKLLALAALAGRMSELRKYDIYIAGLWKNSLLLGLQWMARSPGQQRIGIPVPSWTWASTLTSVDFSEDFELLPSVRLIEVVFIQLGSPHIGYATDTSILLEGPLAKAFGHTTTDSMDRGIKTQYNIPGPSLNYVRSFPDIDVSNQELDLEGIPLTAVLLSCHRDMVGSTICNALILHGIRPGVFERHGFIKCVDPLPDYGRGLQSLEGFIASLPVGRVRII